MGTPCLSPDEPDNIFFVSIQLGSPASGDPDPKPTVFGDITSFHSIGIPSEWGLMMRAPISNTQPLSFHSIGIPSEWGRTDMDDVQYYTGHKFPFNWDPQRVGTLPH